MKWYFSEDKNRDAFVIVKNEQNFTVLQKNYQDMRNRQELQLYYYDRRDDFESALELMIRYFFNTILILKESQTVLYSFVDFHKLYFSNSNSGVFLGLFAGYNATKKVYIPGQTGQKSLKLSF